MSSLVVVGCQWGDEGKGKLVDYLTSNADWVARFHGGNNAGHTLVVDGVTTKLNLIPSGILRNNCRCVLGAGVVIDPQVILTEIEQLRKSNINITPQRLVLDRDAHLILNYHKALDAAKELSRGDKKIGTTGKGIGPAYEDRATRCGIRLAELFHLDRLKPKIEKRVIEVNKVIKNVLEQDLVVSFDEVWSNVEMAASGLTPFVGNVSVLLDIASKADSKIVFEGAQGTLLDQVHGTIPYVTSSNTLSGAVTTGCGIGPKHLDHILGVAKAYCTRVGEGPFPTELKNELGDKIREIGREYGTVTGRARRCGWFDAFAMKRAVRLNGVDSLAITKLDVLSDLDTIKICINYKLNNEKLEDVPSLAEDLELIEPEYIEVPGWKCDISGAKKWHHLPPEARMYLSTLSEILACPVHIVSVGPERNATIFANSASFLKSFCS